METMYVQVPFGFFLSLTHGHMLRYTMVSPASLGSGGADSHLGGGVGGSEGVGVETHLGGGVGGKGGLPVQLRKEPRDIRCRFSRHRVLLRWIAPL